MLNHIVLQARLCRDVELRRLPSGKSVANVSVACDRDFVNKDTGEKETDFLDVVAFGGIADHLAKYYTKGKMIIISGRLQIRNWQDKDGAKRRSAEIVADSVYFGESRKSQEGNNSTYGQNFSQTSQNPYAETEALIAKYTSHGAQQSDFAMLEDNDPSLPF